MDRPPGQLLSAGKCYCTHAFYRCGLYITRLFPLQRAIKARGDSRFDKIKHQTGTFTAFWMAQGLSADPFLLRVLTVLQRHGSFWLACLSILYGSASLVHYQR